MTTADGAVYEGSHAIVTIPLGVLKHRDIEFSPPLDPERLASIERLGFGRFEKIALRFHASVLAGRGNHPRHRPPARPEGVGVPLFGMDAFGHGPTLVAFVFRSSIERFDQLVSGAGGRLGARADVGGDRCALPRAGGGGGLVLGRRPLHPRGVHRDSSRCSSDDIRTLATPAHGRLLFAGEGTTVTRMGYADGAMSTGVREAKRLLQTATVELTT